MAKDKGGPAFPSSNQYAAFDGMTMLDYFAGQAMMGMCASTEPRIAKATNEDLARWAYGIAGAMLEERER